MMIELKLQAAASVTPVRAMGCMHAKQCEAALPPTPRARKAAEMMSELKLQAAASVTPVKETSCTRRVVPEPPKPRARATAEMMRKLKLQRRRASRL